MLRTALLATTLAALGLTGTAQATTHVELGETPDGKYALILTGDASKQVLRISRIGAAGPNDLTISDDVPVTIGEGIAEVCDASDLDFLSCPAPTAFGITLAGGDDFFSVKEKAATWPTAAFDEGAIPYVEVDGGAGADTIMASPGDDLVLGGDGNDTLYEGAGGDDRVEGGDGDDELGDEPGNPEGFFPEEVFAGTDVYRGGPGKDSFDLGSGELPSDISYDDVADDQMGAETAKVDDVGADMEDFRGTDGVNRIVLNDAENDVFTGNGDDFIDGRGGNDTLRGWSDDDVIIGGPGIDDVQGESGNDELFLRDGEPDNGDCGSGNDFAQVDDERSDQTVSGACERIDGPLEPPAPGGGGGGTATTPGGGTPTTPPSGGGGTTTTPGGGTTTPTTPTRPTPTPPAPTPGPTPGPGPTVVVPTKMGAAIAVLLPGRRTVAQLRSGVTLKVAVTGAGKGTATLLSGKRVLGTKAFRATRAGTVNVRLTLSKAAKRTVRRLKGRTLTVRTTFTPTGGAKTTARSTTRVR